jgi:hypothetical protein
VARLYISSTYEDLKDARNVVWGALRTLEHDARGMEAYAATDRRPVEECCDDVAECDGYIGILGGRYGWVPPDRGGKSITQLEYEEAGRRGIPCLMFLMDVPAGLDLDPPLKQFRALAATEHTAKPVRDLAALEPAVLAAVAKTFGTGREVPPLLPYLCDRSPQMAGFKRAFETSFSSEGDGRPLLVLIHGDEREAHGKLIERLCKRFIPENWNPPGRRTSAVKPFILSWPTEWRPTTTAHEQLLDGLSMELRVKSEWERVVEGFVKIPGLSFVQAHVLTDDCRRSGPEAILSFVEFWEKLPFPNRGSVLIVALSIKYRRASKWSPLDWRAALVNSKMRTLIEEIPKKAFNRLRVVALEQLPRVTRNQAEEWAALAETRRFWGNSDLVPHVRRVFEESDDPEEMPMEELAEKLTHILKNKRERQDASQ